MKKFLFGFFCLIQFNFLIATVDPISLWHHEGGKKIVVIGYSGNDVNSLQVAALKELVRKATCGNYGQLSILFGTDIVIKNSMQPLEFPNAIADFLFDEIRRCVDGGETVGCCLKLGQLDIWPCLDIFTKTASGPLVREHMMILDAPFLVASVWSNWILKDLYQSFDLERDEVKKILAPYAFSTFRCFWQQRKGSSDGDKVANFFEGCNALMLLTYALCPKTMRDKVLIFVKTEVAKKLHEFLPQVEFQFQGIGGLEIVECNLGSTRCCAWCGESAELLNCSGCHSVLYCNETCQRAHWKIHRLSCKTHHK